MNLSKVYHVGFLDTNNLNNRPKVDLSYEGNGLSVSQCPEDWIKIAKLGGSNLYLLSKKNPNFFMAHEDDKDTAIQWCIENDYIKSAKRYRAYSSDEDGEEFYMELDKRRDAEQESDDVRPVNGYVFSEKGRNYWKQHFSSKVNNNMAEDFAVVFYAENHDYDGVWWNDVHDPDQLSAPRGVIFQSKLSEWKIIEK